MFDSKNTELWKWHQDGFIDLYALAGLGSTNSFQVQRGRTVVKVVGDDGKDNLFPVNSWVISNYLMSQGKDHRIRVYAITPEGAAEMTDVATRKCKKLGLKLNWNVSQRFPMFNKYPAYEIFDKDDFVLPTAGLDQYFDEYLVRKNLKVNGDDCNLLALCGFHFKMDDDTHQIFGLTGGRDIKEGPKSHPCMVPDRTDQCCNVVRTEGKYGSGVIYRDVRPTTIFRYVLPHEIGHYFGLCHCGHDGIQNIMFKLNESTLLSWETLNFYYNSEPEFTLEDGKNAWRFILNQLSKCL